MYKIGVWKLILFIGVFVFSGLYLLPTIPGVYGRLYGYFDVWMQNKISPPDVQSSKDGEFIRFVIPKADDLPKGINLQEASNSIQDIITRRLSNLGIKNSEFSLNNSVTTDLYIKFNQAKSKPDLEGIISKLQLGVNRPPVLPKDGHQGNIKFTITADDYPAGVGMQETLENIKNKLKEQLQSQGVSDNEFSLNTAPVDELLLKFNQPKSRAEMDKLIGNLHLYGSLPLALRPIFPDNPLKQGLDLKGGMHIVLELDIEKAMDIYLDTQAKEVILGNLKRDKIFCKSVEKTLEKRGDNILVLRPYAFKEAMTIADIKKKLIDLGFSPESIQETSSGVSLELTIRMDVERDTGEILDALPGGQNNPLIVTVTIPQRLQGDAREDYIKTAEKTLNDLELFDKPRLLHTEADAAILSIQLSEESAKKLAEDNIGTVMETLENRINKFGLAESTIRRVRGRPRILIEIPEEQNPARTLAAIKSPGILEFKLVQQDPVTGSGVWSGGSGKPEPSPAELPPGAEVRYHVEEGWYVLDSAPFMTGADLRSNSAMVARGEFGEPEVIMYLTADGQRKFSEFTGQHVNEHTAILLDEVIQSAPRITEKITSRSARITGNFTEEEADYLAKILKAGAFPAPMKSAEERIVGPTLGKEAINKGKLAFVIGTMTVIVFMMIYYKWSGAIAIAVLIFQFQIIMGILAGFGATLTLPGLAGLILTIGMSVDANVLIFERIREELRSGKTIRSSIDSGYQRAFWTILDSNVTTIITAIVLYEFGTGPIKGFAVTLAVGILINMFTAIVVTREIQRLVYFRRRAVTKLSI